MKPSSSFRHLLAAALLFATTPALAGLSSSDRAMIAAVERAQPAAILLLERLVKVNSGTLNLAGVTRVGEMVRAELEPLGFTVVWIPMATAGRAGHLVATHRGKHGTTRILLIGHLDTVFEADSPFQSFVRTGDLASGPGVNDDKGGMVVMLTALRAMKEAGSLRGANIEIVLTGDEERAGAPLVAARADLIAAGRRADIALDFEPLVVIDRVDMGSIARRSAQSYSIATHGVTAHSGLIFSAGIGDGAIYELARIIAAFRTELPEPNLTYNIGVMAGGATASFNANETVATGIGKTNIIPATAVANGDFRALTPEQAERVHAKMQAIVARHAPETKAEIEFEEGYPPMAPTAGNRAILDNLNVINADLGLPLMPELDPLKRGAGDISFVASDVDCLAGLGTAGDGFHTPEEKVDLNSLRRQAKRAAILMTRLSKEVAHRRTP